MLRQLRSAMRLTFGLTSSVPALWAGNASPLLHVCRTTSEKTMTQRLSQAKLQRLHNTLRAVISAVHDARMNFTDCRGLRPRRLAGVSSFLRELLALPHTTDYSVFEVQLKRRLVRTQHRVFGFKQGNNEFALFNRLPLDYEDDLYAYGEVARDVLKALSDVDITKNHQPLKRVAELMAKT